MAAGSYQLTLRSGPTPGKVFTLDKAEIFIGRDLNSDVVVNDAEVSRKHSRMVLQGGSYLLEDLGSTNGTTINGQRLAEPQALHNGDVIGLGEHVALLFEEIRYDPEATVASVRTMASSPVIPPPVQATNVVPPSFAGQVPASPVMDAPAPAYLPPAPPKKKFPVWLIVLLVVVLCIICSCVAGLVYIDFNKLWCSLPVITGLIPGCSVP